MDAIDATLKFVMVVVVMIMMKMMLTMMMIMTTMTMMEIIMVMMMMIMMLIVMLVMEKEVQLYAFYNSIDQCRRYIRIQTWHHSLGNDLFYLFESPDPRSQV